MSSSLTLNQKNWKTLFLIDYDKYYFSTKEPQQEYLFKCQETSTVQDLKMYLKNQISLLSDYEIYFDRIQVFQGDKYEKINNLIDPKKKRIEIFFKIKNKDKQYQETKITSNNSLIQDKNKQEFQYSIYSETTNQKQNNEYENPIKTVDQITLQNYENQMTESKNHSVNQSKIHRITPITQDYLQNNSQIKEFNQITDLQQQNSQPFQTNIETQIKGYCEQILQEYNLRLQKVEQKIYYQEEIQNEKIQKQISQLEQLMKNNQLYYQLTESLINNKLIERQNILEQEHFKIIEDYKLIQLDIQNLKQMIQLQNQTYNYNIDPFQTSQSKQSSQDLSASQHVITLKCRDEIKLQQLQDIIQNAIFQGTKATCQTCLKPISSSDCMYLGQNGDAYLQIQNQNQLSQLQENIEKNQKLQIWKCHENNCNFFCIFDKKLIQERFYFCPVCLIYSVSNLFNSAYRKNEFQKNNSRIFYS